MKPLVHAWQMFGLYFHPGNATPGLVLKTTKSKGLLDCLEKASSQGGLCFSPLGNSILVPVHQELAPGQVPSLLQPIGMEGLQNKRLGPRLLQGKQRPRFPEWVVNKSQVFSSLSI